MRVLIACEYSGTVRDAFLAQGHDAMSCDLLPTDRPGPHYQGDIVDIIGDDWDLMVAHPPCTHLAVSGAKHFKEKQADGRQAAALDFVRMLMDAPTNIVGKGARHVTKSGKSLPQWYNLPPSADRWKIRSATFQGIADAMAAQW